MEEDTRIAEGWSHLRGQQGGSLLAGRESNEMVKCKDTLAVLLKEDDLHCGGLPWTAGLAG